LFIYLSKFVVTVNDVTEVGIDKLTELNINVYPNPTDGIVNVEFQQSFSDQAVIKVINSNGKVIYTARLDSIEKKKIIDLSDEPKGVYYLIITNSIINSFQKIILK
jgi:hypothetical protein